MKERYKSTTQNLDYCFTRVKINSLKEMWSPLRDNGMSGRGETERQHLHQQGNGTFSNHISFCLYSPTQTRGSVLKAPSGSRSVMHKHNKLRRKENSFSLTRPSARRSKLTTHLMVKSQVVPSGTEEQVILSYHFYSKLWKVSSKQEKT